MASEASFEYGIQVSRDAGKTWTQVPGAFYRSDSYYEAAGNYGKNAAMWHMGQLQAEFHPDQFRMTHRRIR